MWEELNTAISRSTHCRSEVKVLSDCCEGIARTISAEAKDRARAFADFDRRISCAHADIAEVRQDALKHMAAFEERLQRLQVVCCNAALISQDELPRASSLPKVQTAPSPEEPHSAKQTNASADLINTERANDTITVPSAVDCGREGLSSEVSSASVSGPHGSPVCCETPRQPRDAQDVGNVNAKMGFARKEDSIACAGTSVNSTSAQLSHMASLFPNESGHPVMRLGASGVHASVTEPLRDDRSHFSSERPFTGVSTHTQEYSRNSVPALAIPNSMASLACAAFSPRSCAKFPSSSPMTACRLVYHPAAVASPRQPFPGALSSLAPTGLATTQVRVATPRDTSPSSSNLADQQGVPRKVYTSGVGSWSIPVSSDGAATPNQHMSRARSVSPVSHMCSPGTMLLASQPPMSSSALGQSTLVSPRLCSTRGFS